MIGLETSHVEGSLVKGFSRLLTVSRQHQHYSAADPLACLQVARLIAHHEGSPQFYAMLPRSPHQHPRFGLAAVAPFAGVMGTVVNAVQASSLRSELLRQSPVDRLYRGRREVAPSDPGLVTDHDRQDARLIQ